MTSNPPAYSRVRRHPTRMIDESLRGASPAPFWLDSPRKPEPSRSLTSDESADLLVVGGGFCGLWTALRAKEREPGRDVVLIEGREIGWAASGRNGGFCNASLTHGEDNGMRHFRDEMPALRRLASQNFADIQDTVARYGVDADFRLTPKLQVATEEYQVEALRAFAAATEESGVEYYGPDEVSRVGASPVYRAALKRTEGFALVDPARLAWELKRVCLELGVRIYEHTPARGLRRAGERVTVRTREGTVQARRVALATNGFPSLLKRTQLLTIPVYDYVLVTEPLSDSQIAAIGWEHRYGITDSSHQFHYYRITPDNRILWGGYDAVYHRGGRVAPEHDTRAETFETLADHFFTTFPSLEGIRFTHAWGGMIDMSTKFVAFQGLALGGRVSYSAGYTGLGVGATRFGADVMLDLLSGEETERTRLRMPTMKPIPIPPEPVAYPAIQLTRRAIAKADANEGREGPLLKAMDLIGVGFDS